MPQVFCKYHPLVAARYHCPRCRIPLCPDCVTLPPGAPRDRAACPVCKGPLDSLGIGNTIQPFWERIPRIFAYPAQGTVLVHLGLLALLSLFGLLPFIGPLVYLFIGFAILKYGYVVLEDTAQGNITPNLQLSEKLGEGNLLPLKQLVVFAVMAMAALVIAGADPVLGIAALLFVILVIPASVITLALEQSMGQALNPTHLAGTIRRIGWPYLLLYFFLLLLSGGSSAAEELLAPLLPEWLFTLLSTLFGGYFTIIMFHLMGYVVYQYHEQLGISGVKEFANGTAPKGGEPTHPLLTEVNILLAEGKPEQARDRLAEELRRSNELPLHDRYHKLLQAMHDPAGLTSHGKSYLAILWAQGKQTRALEVFAACVEADPRFVLASAQQTFALANLAADTRRHDLALRTLSGYAQRFPGDATIPAAYLLAAKLLCERKNDLPQARKVLNSLLGKFPGHPLEPEIRGYLSLVERLEQPVPSAPG